MLTDYCILKILKIFFERKISMFWLGLIIGLVLGANISLFLYAIILTGKRSDEALERRNIK